MENSYRYSRVRRLYTFKNKKVSRVITILVHFYFFIYTYYKEIHVELFEDIFILGSPEPIKIIFSFLSVVCIDQMSRLILFLKDIRQKLNTKL